MKRILFAILITLTITGAVVAQRDRPRPGGPEGPGGPSDGPAGTFERGHPRDPLTGLQAALSLTDAQVEAIKALRTTRDQRAQAIRTEMEQKRAALDALLDAASPSPTDVGNAAISLRASQNRLPAERDWFVTEFKKLLTGDQQQKLDTLITANPGFPLLGPRGPGRGPRPQ